LTHLFFKIRHIYVRVDERPDVLHPGSKSSSFFHTHLASDQVIGVNKRSAFPYGKDFRIPQVLFNGIFLRVSHTSQYLNRLGDHTDTCLTSVTLNQRCQNFRKRTVSFRFFFIGGIILNVQVVKSLKDHGADAFNMGFHIQKHPANVFMSDNGHAFGSFDTKGSSLNPFCCILRSKIAGGGSLGIGVMARSDTRLVHHMEHHGQSLGKSIYVRRGPKHNAPAIVLITKI
jgi:hypothetical protein